MSGWLSMANKFRNGSSFWSGTPNSCHMVAKRHIKQKKSENKGAKFYCLLNGLVEPLGRAFRIVKVG